MEEPVTEDPPKEEHAQKNAKKKHSKKGQKPLKRRKTMRQVLKEKLERDKAKNRQEYLNKNDLISRLQKYDEKDKVDVENQEFIAPENFKGPNPKRKATNKVWVYIFLLFNVLFLFHAIFALKDGQSKRLFNGMDFRGEMCGVDKYKDKKYLYFANPVFDIDVAFCLATCPQSTGQNICLYDVDGVTPTRFCYTQMQTTILGRYCLPVEPVNGKLVDDYISSFDRLLKRLVADLNMVIDVILAGILFSIAFSYIYLTLLKMKNSTAFMAWGSIIGTLAGLAIFCYMCKVEYDRFKGLFCPFRSDCGGWRITIFLVTYYIFMVFGALYVVYILLNFKKISLAIGIIKQAARCTQVLTQLRIVPIIITMIILFFGGIVIFIVIYALSCGDIVVIPAQNIDGEKVKSLEYTVYLQWLLIYDFYMLIYWVYASLTFSDLITSYAICIWFFTKRKDTVELPVFRAIKDVVKYHMGTVFFFAFLSTFIQIPKLILGVFIMLLRKLKQHSNFNRFTMAACMFPIHIYQIFLRYISKTALVQVAMWSTPFYSSSKKSYFLTFRNEHIIKDLDKLQSFIILQTRLCSSIISALVVYLYLLFLDQTFFLRNKIKDIETPFGPVLVVFLIAFIFTSIFQGSFDVTSKTILQNYLLDCEMFMGEQRYAEDFIRDFMEYFGKVSSRKILVKSQVKNEGELIEDEVYDDEDKDDDKAKKKKTQDDEEEYESDYDSDDDSDDYEEEGSDEDDDDDEESGSGDDDDENSSESDDGKASNKKGVNAKKEADESDEVSDQESTNININNNKTGPVNNNGNVEGFSQAVLVADNKRGDLFIDKESEASFHSNQYNNYSNAMAYLEDGTQVQDGNAMRTGYGGPQPVSNNYNQEYNSYQEGGPGQDYNQGYNQDYNQQNYNQTGYSGYNQGAYNNQANYGNYDQGYGYGYPQQGPGVQYNQQGAFSNDPFQMPDRTNGEPRVVNASYESNTSHQNVVRPGEIQKENSYEKVFNQNVRNYQAYDNYGNQPNYKPY